MINYLTNIQAQAIMLCYDFVAELEVVGVVI